MNIFEQVKNALDIISVAEMYGVNVVNGTKALCPFHDDTNPSMSFKDDICTCWVCVKTFDCIGLVSELFDLKPLEAVKKLIQDFGLNIAIGQPVSKDYINQINKEKELISLFDKWEKDAFITVTDYLHLLNNWKQQYAPTKEEFMSGSINEKYVETCHKIDYIEYLTDVFIYGSYKDKIELYKTHRNEVKIIGNKIREIRNVGTSNR